MSTDGSAHPVELALPIVLRLERDDPPLRTDALEAAARAALLMLTADQPQWRPAIEAWDGHRIRKVVRRARGAHWRRAHSVDGLDVRHGTAQVYVCPPVPADDWPPDLARLQVGGTDLEPDRPDEPPPDLPLVLLAPHIATSTGKAMAQAGHAAHLGWRSLGVARRAAWQVAGFPLAVRTASAGQWAEAVPAGAPVVHDAGFTEVAPGTATALFLTG